MMEKKYQHMMEQVNMDEGFASGLLEQIQAERPQKRPQPLRTALIAACVCLALVGTAVAVSYTHLDVYKRQAEKWTNTSSLPSSGVMKP